jgi:hypothetical protein
MLYIIGSNVTGYECNRKTIHGSGVAPACLARLSNSSAKRNKHKIRILIVQGNTEEELTPWYRIFLKQLSIT